MSIITDPNLLRRPCLPATLEEAPGIIAQLEAELKKSAERGRPGVGLASPQIGILKTVAIVRFTSANGVNCNINLVNARIAARHDEFIFENEGCLSFPGKYVKTKRYNEIHVVDNLVEPHSFITTGLLSTVILHEMDHLDGVLLPDLEVK